MQHIAVRPEGAGHIIASSCRQEEEQVASSTDRHRGHVRTLEALVDPRAHIHRCVGPVLSRTLDSAEGQPFVLARLPHALGMGVGLSLHRSKLDDNGLSSMQTAPG